ncbi:hypothetical protein QEN19_000296 [Hanseniaspora menglaensis]
MTDTDCKGWKVSCLLASQLAGHQLVLASACNELQELRCWLYDFMTGCVCNQCMLYHAALPNFTITKVLHLATPHHLALCSINNIPQRLASACNELQELRCWLYDFMTGCVVGNFI